MRARVALPAILAAALLASTFGVVADHAQSGSGRSVAFDHVTGNEWWVEVRLTGTDASSVTAVEAQDANGPWTALPKSSWGPFAASFHIEPGNQVRFRASWSDGAQVPSCWFTHPAGVEQCGSSTTTTTTMTMSSTTTTTSSSSSTSFSPPFHGSFTGVRGNEWWVQAASVSTPHGLSQVHATIDGGLTYKPLTKQSWGGWAASFRIAQGSTVQLRATAEDGSIAHSACYRWIPPSNADAAVVPCPGATSSSSTTGSSTTTSGAPGMAWSSRTVATMPWFKGPLLPGDVDGDGDRELLVMGEDGLHLIQPGASGPVFLDSAVWWQGQMADADNDGTREAYFIGVPSGQDSNEMRQVRITGDRITGLRPIYGTYDQAGPFQVIDLDGDGREEVYVARQHYESAVEGYTVVIERVDVTDPWTPPRVAVDLGDGGAPFHSMWGLEAATIHGKPTLLALAITSDGETITNHIHVVRVREDGVTTATRIGGFAGESALFDVGDVDRDGVPDLVTGTATEFLVYQDRGGFWSEYGGRPIAAGMMDGAFGDGDGDGKVELYVGADDGRLYAVTPYHAGGYVAQAVATLATAEDFPGPFHVVVGNGDGDAAPEVYSIVYTFDGVQGLTSVLFETSFGPATPFDATFTGVKGNGWWVQANVAAKGGTLAGVDVRVNCGATWRPLTLQNWGGWTASFNIPAGSKVDFRARSTTGATDLSGAYLWPNATPTSACP